MRDLKELGLKITEQTTTANPQSITERIGLIENLLGAKLPAAYVEFLKFCNGGRPALNTFYSEFAGNEQNWEISTFFHLSSNPTLITYPVNSTHDNNDDLILQYNQHKDFLPAQLLPFGLGSLGDLFCIDLSRIGNGKIMIWKRDAEPDFALTTVADSFEQFIDALTKNRLNESL